MSQSKHKFVIDFVVIGVLAVLVAVSVAAIILKSARRENPTLPTPEALSSQSEARASLVAQKHTHVVEPSGASASSAVPMICGESAVADRYEARNNALRSIARRRDLSEEDVAALMEYVAATGCVMHVEREAALKNDVLNLLRNQKRQPEGLVDLLLKRHRV